MSDHSEGYDLGRKEALEQLTANEAEILELRKQRIEYDCRFTLGDVANISGIHCPVDRPCMRCQVERRDEEIEKLETETLNQQIVIGELRKGWKEKDAEIARLTALLRERPDQPVASDYDPDPVVASILRADAQPPEAGFDNVADMLNWLNETDSHGACETIKAKDKEIERLGLSNAALKAECRGRAEIEDRLRVALEEIANDSVDAIPRTRYREIARKALEGK